MTESTSQNRRSFGDYDLVRELGRGGMGLVYEAHERALDRRVALKVLPKELAHDASYAQRFLNEARAAARLNHPNIVTIHAVGQVNDRHYIAMELVEGVSLSAWVKRHGAMDAHQALGLIRQVAEALAEAHRRGIIHRDIKPQNIMVDETGRVKVLDFGLAKVLESASELTAQGSQLGTPRYMAPEQIQGKQVDARSDIYSLGVVLYELLVGRVAFEGDSPMTVMYKIVHEPFPEISQSNPGVPLPVVQLLQKMTAREPDRRPQTASELIQAIDGAREGRMVFDNVLGQPGALQPTGFHGAPLLDDRLRTEIIGATLSLPPQPKRVLGSIRFKRAGLVAAVFAGIVILGFPVAGLIEAVSSWVSSRGVTYSYDFSDGKLPQLKGWTFTQEGNPQSNVSIGNGILTLDSAMYSRAFWELRFVHGSADPTRSGIFMEIVARIVSESHRGNPADRGAVLAVLNESDGSTANSLSLMAWKDRIFVNDSKDRKVATHSMNTTNEFHTYRFELVRDNFTVSVDGVVVLSGHSPRSNTNSIGLSAVFGDNTGFSAHRMEVRSVSTGVLPP